MARKKSGREGGTYNGEVMEWWWRLQPAIDGELVAKDGLRKRRLALEAILAPYVTRQKTKDQILLKGKRRYVKLPERDEESRLAWAAVEALQCLYNLEAAWKAGDTDELVRWTYGFARLDHEVELVKRVGWDSGCLGALWDLEKRKAYQRRVAGGKKSAKWNSELKRLASQYIDDAQRNSKLTAHAVYKHAVRKLKSNHSIDISISTLKRRLPIQR